MGAVPGWLLRHTIMIEPFLGTWGRYGPATPAKAAKQEKISGAVSKAGSVRYVSVTLVCLPGTPCPDGSRITLPDGRRGYAQAVADHDAGGLPTPDHVEIALTAPAVAYGAPLGGETVAILRRVAAGEDRYGNARYRIVETWVEGCAVRVLSADERAQDGGSRLVDTIEVVFPPDTDLTANDRLRVRGLVYEVDGRPDEQHEPMTGAKPGVRVVARRVSGDR